MKDGKAVKLLLNEAERGHGDVIEKLLKQAERLECLVAFAKASALNRLLKPLHKALEGGLEARFAIGLDFYLTEPAVLRKLLALTEKKHALKLYLSDSSDTFHPKVYAFQHGKGCSVIVGSANFTHGGLYGNYEASAVIEDEKGTLMASVTKHFDALLTNEVLVSATKGRIDDYERAYVIHNAYRNLAKGRAERARRTKGEDSTLLSEILAVMKRDASELGFNAQKRARKNNLREAKQQLEVLAALHGNVGRIFPARYDALIGSFHSGGLHRGKSRIAEHPERLVAAVRDIIGTRNLSPADAFAILHGHFGSIPGAGINLLTEILHALDNKRYAVMNQNAVSGLMLAGIRDYPLHPTKQNVNANSYAHYCQHADAVRQELGLADFTELDALFNYAYWGESTGDEADD
ncbi:MAG: NgoFVII family restriction endonuclease [Nevskiales bacterium]|nr:NgoFVII family restriction endonuclease [Nevskiales bacterium]